MSSCHDNIFTNAYKESLNYIQEITSHTLLSSAWTLTTNLGLSLSIDFTFQGTGYTEAHQEIAFLSRHPHSPSSSHITLSGRRQSIRVHRRAFPRCAMPATSKITFTNECHSFVSGQHTEGRVAPKRIPRPPNAFMLYRSDFLKRGAVPPEVEKRQQNLSRIAGQCWNMLPETEKAIWYGKAGVVRAERRARYPSHKTGPFHKDTNRLSAKDERIGSATNSGRSFGRSGTRRMQITYCEGMFAALHDSKITSPTSQASLLSPTPASMSPSSTTASLSPLSLPQLLPPFISYTHPSMQNLSPTTFESSIIWKNKIGYLLDLSGFEMPQRGLRDLDTKPSDIGSSKEPYPALQQYEDSFASCVPYPCVEQLPELRSDPVDQVPLTLPGSNAFSPERYPFGAGPSFANDFGVTDDDFAHFDQSLIPLYPWHSDELNTSG